MIAGELVNDVAKHYDILIDEGQDPVHDPEILREYMNKWDGQAFIDKMKLDKSKSVLEIGVGTGRIAVKIEPLCKRFTGIDVSAKTIEVAKKNIKTGFLKKPELICADFLEYEFTKTFDVIYSSLTFMHIENKQKAFDVAFRLLNEGGLFVLSIDKSQSEFLDAGTTKVKIFPDKPENIRALAINSGLKIIEEDETEFAHIFVLEK